MEEYVVIESVKNEYDQDMLVIGIKSGKFKDMAFGIVDFEFVENSKMSFQHCFVPDMSGDGISNEFYDLHVNEIGATLTSVIKDVLERYSDEQMRGVSPPRFDENYTLRT